MRLHHSSCTHTQCKKWNPIKAFFAFNDEMENAISGGGRLQSIDNSQHRRGRNVGVRKFIVVLHFHIFISHWPTFKSPITFSSYTDVLHPLWKHRRHRSNTLKAWLCAEPTALLAHQQENSFPAAGRWKKWKIAFVSCIEWRWKFTWFSLSIFFASVAGFLWRSLTWVKLFLMFI